MKNKKKILISGLCSFLAIGCLSGGIGWIAQADKLGVQEGYPIFQVQFGETDEMPYAVVGTPFKVFDAEVSGKKASQTYEVSSSVYFNYYSDTPIDVSVENGVFLPWEEGLYTIVYTAKSGSNIATHEIDVMSYMNSPLSIEALSGREDYTIGDVITVEAPSVKNNSGEYAFVVTAICDGKTYPLTQNGSAFSYKAMKAGSYSLCYVYTDYTQSITKTEEITVLTGTGYEIAEDSYDPLYLVKNAEYSFDSVVYYDLSENELAARMADMTYSADGAAENLYAAGSVFKVSANNSLRISYYSGTNKIKSKEWAVIDAGYNASTGSIAPYALFVDESGTFVHMNAPSEKSSPDTYPIWKTSQDAALEFANKVLVENFSLNVNFPVCGAGVLKVSLQDYYDRENLLEISVRPRSDNASADVYVNGIYAMRASVTYTSGVSFTIRYLCTSNTLIIGGSSANLDELFGGFSRACACLKVAVEEVTSETQLCIQSVNSQMIYNSKNVIDQIEAQCSIWTNGMYYTFGERLQFYTQVADIYSPSATATFSVYAPSGENAVAEDGTVLKNIAVTSKVYSVRLNEYGRYLISVKTDDGMDNMQSYTKNVYTIDKELPVVMVNDIVQEFVVGQTAIIKASSADEIDGVCSVRVVVFTPSSVGEVLQSDVGGVCRYSFAQCGIYTICVYSSDEAGNQTTKVIKIMVKED